jgi:hypothetical protein
MRHGLSSGCKHNRQIEKLLTFRELDFSLVAAELVRVAKMGTAFSPPALRISAEGYGRIHSAGSKLRRRIHNPQTEVVHAVASIIPMAESRATDLRKEAPRVATQHSLSVFRAIDA